MDWLNTTLLLVSSGSYEQDIRQGFGHSRVSLICDWKNRSMWCLPSHSRNLFSFKTPVDTEINGCFPPLFSFLSHVWWQSPAVMWFSLSLHSLTFIRTAPVFTSRPGKDEWSVIQQPGSALLQTNYALTHRKQTNTALNFTRLYWRFLLFCRSEAPQNASQ